MRGLSVYSAYRRQRAKRRALARPLAVGLLACACLTPLPRDALPLVGVRADEFAKEPRAIERQNAPEPSVPVPSMPKTELAASLEPIVLPPPAPVVLTVSGSPPLAPFVTPPLPDVRSTPELPALAQPARLAQREPVPSVEAAIAPAAPSLAVAMATAPSPLLTPPAPETATTVPAPLRSVDIAQIGESAAGIRVPQLHEPGLVPGGPNLADKTAAMQVVLPPPARLTEQELALLQTDAPAELTVRIGREAVGKVAFRMSESRSIDVQLSGLLDVLADRFAPEDFARLRGAAAADNYVPLDNLRAVGLSLRYDPVYDELRVSA